MYLSLQEVLRPTRLESCLETLVDDETAILSGGTWLNAICPSHLVRLVDLQALPLRDVVANNLELRFGALVRLSTVFDGDRNHGFAALREAVRDERNLPIRNQSTLGGRCGRRRADARVPTALLALNATLEVACLYDGQVQYDRTYLDELATYDLSGRIITAIALPFDNQRSGYRSFGLTAVDAPMTDVAVAQGNGGWRIASGGHGDDIGGVRLLSQAAKVLDGADDDDSWRDRLREAIVDNLPDYSDARASGDYRRAVAATLIVRLAEDLRAQGGAA